MVYPTEVKAFRLMLSCVRLGFNPASRERLGLTVWGNLFMPNEYSTSCQTVKLKKREGESVLTPPSFLRDGQLIAGGFAFRRLKWLDAYASRLAVQFWWQPGLVLSARILAAIVTKKRT